MQEGLRRDLLPSPEGIGSSSTQGYIVHTLVCLAPTKLHLWSSVAESVASKVFSSCKFPKQRQGGWLRETPAAPSLGREAAA